MRGGGWTGDLNIADWQQVEHATYSTGIYAKRFKAAEVEPVWRSETFCFPVAEGDLCLPGDSKEALIRRVGHQVYYKNKPKPSDNEGKAESGEASTNHDE